MRMIRVFLLLWLCVLMLPAQAFTVVELKEAGFTYRPEVGPFYALEREAVKNRQDGLITRKQAFELYQKLEEGFTVNADLKAWDASNGVEPLVIRVKAKVKNYGNQVSDSMPLVVTIWARMGEYYVNPRTLLVDELHLKRSARWEQLETQNLTIPMLANGESYTVMSNPIALGRYWLGWRHRYPVALKAQVRLPATGAEKTFEIPVHPGPFAVGANAP